MTVQYKNGNISFECNSSFSKETTHRTHHLMFLFIQIENNNKFLEMLENELAILSCMFSPRRNGSYDELAVNCGGVVTDIFAVDVWLYAAKPFLAVS